MMVRLLDTAFPVPALPLPPEDLQYEVRCLRPLRQLCGRLRLLRATGLSQAGP